MEGIIPTRRKRMRAVWGSSGGAFSLPSFDPLIPSIYLDPAIQTSVFKGDAMTAPAAVGDPVSKLADLSGKGWHFIQPDVTKRPILRQTGSLYYLEPDGVDDYMYCLNVNLSPAHQLSIFLVHQFPDYASQVGNNVFGNLIDENGVPASAGQTAFEYLEGRSSSGHLVNQSLVYTDDPVAWSFLVESDFTRPLTTVMAWRLDYTKTSLITQCRVYWSNVQRTVVPQAGSPDPINNAAFGTRTWTLGDMLGATSQPWKGKFYGLLLQGRLMDDAEFLQMGHLMGAKAGLSI